MGPAPAADGSRDRPGCSSSQRSDGGRSVDAVSRSGKISAPLGSRRGRMVDLGGLVEQTMESIEAWMADHPGTWVALSGGKDSTAVAHLARRVDPVSYTHLTLPTNREV